jgi:hypothetical protein
MKKGNAFAAFAALMLMSAVFSRAELKFGFGWGSEMGSAPGSPTANPGNTPLLSGMPQLYIESVFRRSLTQGSLGVDLFLTWATHAGTDYLDAYQPFYQYYTGDYWNLGDPGLSTMTPELIITSDLTYHLPAFGPNNLVDLQVFGGGGLWMNLGDSSNVPLPISPGFFAQAGAAVQLNFRPFFIQGRGALRLMFSESALAAGGTTPVPLGNSSLMVLAGFIF